MIGNDIVDLKQAARDSNWRRPRFLDKIFTTKEQQLISASEDQHEMVWLLWSMKEAAYKVNVQQFEKRFFNPKRIECDLISDSNGLVSIGSEKYFTCSEISEDYIYTIANQEKSKEAKNAVFKTENPLYKTQSDALKKKFLKKISEREGLAIQTLSIKKTVIGTPQIFSDSVKLTTSFSLTHHGFFSAFSIL